MEEKSRNRTYADLAQLSMEQLEDLLRADLASPDQRNEDVIFYILELMERREQEHPTGRLPDTARAWEEFQEYYCIPEGEGRSLYSGGPGQGVLPMSKFSRRIRQCAVAAAVLAILLGGMLTVQASGVDLLSAHYLQSGLPVYMAK